MRSLDEAVVSQGCDDCSNCTGGCCDDVKPGGLDLSTLEVTSYTLGCASSGSLINDSTILNTTLITDPWTNIDTSLQVKVKKLDPKAVIPSYAKPGDAGLDLTAVSKEWDEKNGVVVIGTGLAFEIPEGHVGLIVPRSSIYKTPLMLANSIGVIDSGYRGEVKFMFRPVDRARQNYEIGDRIGQIIIIPYPRVAFTEVSELPSSDRGVASFGSSGS